jgi:hypothetical protein
MKQGSKAKQKKADPRRTIARRQESAYGCEVPICMNAGCVMRKKAACLGFEGCPGFKGK